MPKCEKTGCFANKKKECTILENNDFGKRECPFFKSNAQMEREKLIEKKLYSSRS